MQSCSSGSFKIIEANVVRTICSPLSRQFIELAKNQYTDLNPLSANPTKWRNTLKQFVGKLTTNCLSVFGHFAKLALKGLIIFSQVIVT